MDYAKYCKIVNKLEKTEEKYLETVFESSLKGEYRCKTVLGIDIYQYSKYKRNAQSLIPFIVIDIMNDTITKLNEYESIFNNIQYDNFRKNFINTGDGGYIIFENPIYAIIYLIYFSFALQQYNTKIKYPNIYKIVGNISVRYSLTMDDIFSFENNWYGPAIISCSRILSKDKLNRFLIDENVKIWFDHNFNGIETLSCIGLNNIKEPLNNILQKDVVEYKSLIIPKEGDRPGKSNIININLSKIGKIEIKNDYISIYNLHIQVYLVLKAVNDPKLIEKYIITIGNLNTSGI